MAGKRTRAFTSIMSVLKQHPRVSTVSPFVQRRKDELKDRKEIFMRLPWKKAARLRFQHRVYLPTICVFFLIKSYALKKQNIIRKGKSPVSHLIPEDDLTVGRENAWREPGREGRTRGCWEPSGSSSPTGDESFMRTAPSRTPWPHVKCRHFLSFSVISFLETERTRADMLRTLVGLGLSLARGQAVSVHNLQQLLSGDVRCLWPS